MAVRLREADNMAAMAELQQQISELEIQVKSPTDTLQCFPANSHSSLCIKLQKCSQLLCNPHLTINKTPLQHTVSVICITEDDGLVGQRVFLLASCN